MWLTLCAVVFAVAWAPAASAQALKRNPSPQDYVERNGGGATIVPPGRLVLDGHRVSCGQRATILDPNLNDYAASYPQFVILNMPYVATVPTVVKLWIYSHECGHLFGGSNENKADCFAVRSGRAAGWLNAKGLNAVCSFISAARPDATHLSGTGRCELMRACWRQAAPKPEATPQPNRPQYLGAAKGAVLNGILRYALPPVMLRSALAV